VKNSTRSSTAPRTASWLWAGDFNQGQLQAAAAELLGGWSSAVPYQRMTTPYQKVAPVNLKIETPDKEMRRSRPACESACRTTIRTIPPCGSPIPCSEGHWESRMPNRIRNVEGLSYSVGSRFTAPSLGKWAQFSGSAISAPQNTPKVEASFKDELARTLRSGFTADEVAAAKKAFHDAQIVGRSREQSLIRNIAVREQSGRSMKWDEQLERRFRRSRRSRSIACSGGLLRPRGVVDCPKPETFRKPAFTVPSPGRNRAVGSLNHDSN